MGTIRRVLECGHVQRMDTVLYEDLLDEREGRDLVVMRCMRCDGEIRKVIGPVPPKEASA